MSQSTLEGLFREEPLIEKAALVAELYYIYKLPQKKIATQLGISRPWVSKLLKKAEESGLVTVHVETAWAGVESLEVEMKNHFPALKDVKVVASVSSEDQTLKNAARAASHYLVSILKGGDVVSFSWGYTLAALAQEFVRVPLEDISLLPMVGGMGENTQVLSNYIVDTIARKTGASYQLLHLPAFVAGKAQKEILLSDPYVEKIINGGEEADIILYSIGPLYKSTMAVDGYISPTELKELEALGAVGDVALQYITKEGRLVNHPIKDRIVSGDFITSRKNARLGVALAVGEYKAPVIHAALKGELLDVLITDSNTALKVLELEKNKGEKERHHF